MGRTSRMENMYTTSKSAAEEGSMLEQQNCQQNHGLFLFKAINLKLLFTASVQ